MSSYFKIFIIYLLVITSLSINAQVILRYIPKDINNPHIKNNLSFKNLELAKKNVQNQLLNWQSQGYISLSVDSVIEKKDSLINYIFFGKKYSWQTIVLSDSIKNSLVNIFEDVNFNSSLSINKLINLPDTLLKYFQNNGYPFATIQYKNIEINDDKITAVLDVEKGIKYKIDSIRLFGNLKIQKHVLTKLIGITNNSWYNESILNNINRNLDKINYIKQFKPWDITLLANSSIVNIYANKINKNKLDAIIGFLPNNQQTNGSLLLTVDAKLHLENAFSTGEIIDVNWQQIQPQSPRIDINFNKPFILKSKLGFLAEFNLYKRDSAFLNVQAKLGVQYPINDKTNIDIFINSASTRVIEPDTFYIIANKRLPNIQDVSFSRIGINYNYNNTNNNYNPSKGIQLKIQTTAGLKTIEKNNNFLNIKTGNFNYKNLYDTIQLNDFQLKLITSINSYIKVGKLTVLKMALNSGYIQTNNLLQNEMFQIGGFKLLRGFDEENIFTNAYAVASSEMRFLFGERNYFFGFTDYGLAQNKNINKTFNYIGFGGGMSLNTKQGLLQFSIALGKRNDLPLNFRETKIHVGLVNNF